MTEEIKEDFLEVDQKIPGQNYVCLSFVSPDNFLKKKEVFYATKFLDYIMNDQEKLVQDIREKMINKETSITYDNVEKIYEDWKYSRNECLDAEFYELSDYRTSMRGIKVRGVYDSYKEASVRAQVLRRRDPSFNVFVGQVGYWLPWDPECESVPEQEYQEGQLNELVKKYKENLNNRDDLYEQVKNERIEKAKREVNAKKEMLKAQNEMNVPENNDEENTKNIEQLRNIVDESDKLYYDNLKKASSEEVSPEEVSPEEVSPEEVSPEEVSPEEVSSEEVSPQEVSPDGISTQEVSPEEASVDKDTLNNFKVETMESLESDDPWLTRKNK
jgi:hypothetical protein